MNLTRGADIAAAALHPVGATAAFAIAFIVATNALRALREVPGPATASA